jgi:hypothetical protein
MGQISDATMLSGMNGTVVEDDHDNEDDDYDKDFWGPRQEEIQPDPDHNPGIQTQRSPSPPLMADDIQPTQEMPDMYEIVHLLSMHHGFVPPIPVPHQARRMEPEAIQAFLRVVGLT